jgi:hypothetical protein
MTDGAAVSASTDEKFISSLDENNAFIMQQIIEEASEELFQYFHELRAMLENKNVEEIKIEPQVVEKPSEQKPTLGVRIVSKLKKEMQSHVEEPKTSLATQSADRLWNYYNHLLETFKERLPQVLEKPGGSVQLLETAKRNLYRFYLGEVCKLYGDTNPQLVSELQLQANLFGTQGENDLVDNKHATMSIKDWRYKNMIRDHDQMLPNPDGDMIPASDDGLLHRGANEISKMQQQPKPLWKRILVYLSFVFPIIVWFPEYCKRSEIFQNIKRDVLAGVTIAIVLCPQGIAYALVAGMPPIYGLYTAFIPGLIYPWLGTSRVLAVG